VIARTRREAEALKAVAVPLSPPRDVEAVHDNVKRAGTPRGEPTAREENALKGEVQGRSGASAPAGPMV